MSDLYIEEQKKINSKIELACRFESKMTRHRLWYRVELRREEELCNNADPFVLGILQIAMNAGEPLRVHGRVSPSLLRNLEDFQKAWAAWIPEKYKVIDIRADDERESEMPDNTDAIMCFSGGVDSCFTAFRHAKGISTSFPQPLRTAVLVHGFDIPLNEPEYYESAYGNVKYQLDSIGIRLYRVETNFKEISVFWPHAFGTGVASVLSLFKKKYSKGLIAQGVPFSSYKNLVEGSNPLTDNFLSSEQFRIIPDGSGFQRAEKIKVISKWTEGMKHLRVCWEGEEKDKNCCVCEKCIRNILTFRSLKIPIPSAFPKDVDDDRIFKLGPLKEIIISVGYDVILKFASENGMENESWILAMKKAVDRSRKIRKMSLTMQGRIMLWFVRLFNKVWRQPASRIKF